MRIRIITPAARPARAGNQTTAARWQAILQRQGHLVGCDTAYRGEDCDLLIALHAWRSAEAIEAFHTAHPDRGLVVALTGTDLYQHLHSHPGITARSLALADVLIGLHDLVRRDLPQPHHARLRVLHQSAPAVPRGRLDPDHFDVCVIGHLRAVKDPLQAAWAVRQLPPGSRIRITHLGSAIDPELAEAARAEAEANPRYRWRGGVGAAEVRRVLSTSRLMVLSSRAEGGANVISEAVRAGVPVLSTPIVGSVGLLGEDYPGYFPVGDTPALRRALLRAESDAAFAGALEASRAALAPRFAPEREAAGWRALLQALAP